MGVRSRSSDAPSKVARHAEMIATKRGIYLVRGDRKLRNIQLISWEQLLNPEVAKPNVTALPRIRTSP